MAVGITVTEAPATGYLKTDYKMSHHQANRFDDLVIKLKEALGPSSGLTSEDVDVEQLTQLMAAYDSDEQEWERYSLGDHGLPYTRNLVDEGNGKSNLVSLPQTRKPSLANPVAAAAICMQTKTS